MLRGCRSLEPLSLVRGSEKAHSGGLSRAMARPLERVGRAGHGVPSREERVSVLGLGGAQKLVGRLNVRMEVDMLGGGREAFAWRMEVWGEWGVRWTGQCLGIGSLGHPADFQGKPMLGLPICRCRVSRVPWAVPYSL